MLKPGAHDNAVLKGFSSSEERLLNEPKDAFLFYKGSLVKSFI